MLFLLLLLGSGYLIARRFLRENHRPTAVCAGTAFSATLFLLVVNVLGRMTTVANASWAGVGLLVVLSLGCLYLAGNPAESWELWWGTKLYLGLVGLCVYVYITLCQNLMVDDDYWIHTPLMGLLKSGKLPPPHPFFADITMNGHYGRDLLIASSSCVAGGSVLSAQMLVTTAAGLLSFLILFANVFAATRSQFAAVLSTALVTFGINVGSRMGAIDTYQNNNAVVQLLGVLYLYMLGRAAAQDKPAGERIRACAAAGITLGVLAFTYETHFGLCVIATVGLAVLRGLRTLQWRPELLGLALMLGLGGSLAITQGGPFTDLASRRFSAASEPGPKLSAGEMNQRQMVSLVFPKDNLFQIYLEEGTYRRLSSAYQAFPGLAAQASIAPGATYYSIWSRQVLQIHWLATFLGPLALGYLIQRRCDVGTFLAFFAILSYLVPGLVDFGPTYESEYFRWQYAAGWGFAAAVGISLGLLIERRQWAWVALSTLVTVACITPFFTVDLPYRLQQAKSARWNWFLRPLPIAQWLEIHKDLLAVRPTDTLMALALLDHSQPGQTVLMNFPAFSLSSIYLESTLSGLTGLRFQGHSLPLEHEIVGTTPYHMAAPARAFWGSLEPTSLRQLGVDWLYLRPGPEVRPDTLRRLEAMKGLEKVATFQDEAGPYRLYRVNLAPLSTEFISNQAQVFVEHWEALSGAKIISRSCYTDARIQLRNDTSVTFPKGTLMASGFDADPVSRELVLWPLRKGLAPGESITQDFPLVAPHGVGQYEIQVYLESPPGSGQLSPLPGNKRKLRVR